MVDYQLSPDTRPGASGKDWVLKIGGRIEETAAIDSILAKVAPHAEQLRIDTSLVTRINSTGTKLWMTSFAAFRAARPALRMIMESCSPAVVEQLSMIKNFHCGAQVESIYLPYVCPSCKNDVSHLMPVATLLAAGIEKLPEPPCSTCGKPTEFDDMPDEYFSFLKHLPGK